MFDLDDSVVDGSKLLAITDSSQNGPERIKDRDQINTGTVLFRMNEFLVGIVGGLGNGNGLSVNSRPRRPFPHFFEGREKDLKKQCI